MRVVAIGATGFGLRCLDAVSKLEEVEIVGVITNFETFKISYSQDKVKNVLYADFLSWAKSNGVSCYGMTENMKEPTLLSWLEERKPDLLIVLGWYHMVPRNLRQIAPAIGLHASLLPDYSGGAPLVWAMINGEKETGITLFQLDDGVDDGPIYGQASTPIFPEDTIATLYDRVEELGKKLLLDNLPKIAVGKAVPVMQDETKRRTYPQRAPADGIIDWQQSAQKIYDFVRAQTGPYPGAFTFHEGRKIIIWSCEKEDELVSPDYPAGTVCFPAESDRVRVYTGCNGIIALNKVEIEGREIDAEALYPEYLKAPLDGFDLN